MATILIIDHEVAMCQLLRKVLQTEGYQVYSTTNSRVAANLLKKLPVDLILSDQRWLEMDGYTFCREVRKKFNIPLLVLTATHVHQEMRRCLEAGKGDYMLKPFGLADMRAQVNRMVSG